MNRISLVTAFVLGVSLAIVSTATAGPIGGTLYYTTFNDVSNANGTFQVWKVDYSYNGNGTAGSGVFSLTNNTGIANTNGADGIVFLPNGNLAIGGQNTGLVHEVTPGGAIISSQASSAGAGGAFHLSVDPTGSTLYVSGIPGDVGAMSIGGGSPGLTAPGVNHNVVGADQVLTSLIFDPLNSTWFYTSSGSGGFGSFGTVAGVGGAGNYTTTQLFSNVPSAHGMAFDPFTGDILLFGDGQLSQYRPSLNAFIGTLSIGGVNFDQGAVDGLGHLFVADNGGSLQFIDYSTTGSVSSALNFTARPFLNSFLDDVAPLSGPGSNAPVPEPATMTLFLVGAGIAGTRALRNKRR